MQLLENLERVQLLLLLSRRSRTGVNSDRITCPSVLRFQQFSPLLSLVRTHWFSRHVPPGVYALHITHTQRGLIKVSAKPPWKVARRIIAPAIWQTQQGKSFPFFFSFFPLFTARLLFNFSGFPFRCTLCCLRSWNCFLFEVARATREREGERERGRNDSATVAESVP